MAQEEIYGKRNSDYSAWHRRNSTRRFVGIEDAQLLAMIDLDACLWIEYDNNTKDPVVLIETAVDVGQSHKPTTVTRKLAERAGVPALLVLYSLADCDNPANANCQDISGFRVKRIWPNPRNDWKRLTPEQYAKMLLRARRFQTNRLDELFDFDE
jgi:hypothetical protein